MSKERLEEIRKDVFSEGLLVINESDFWHLYEQAERVQELENENRALRTVAASNKFIGEQYLEQNKRYREALEFYANEENYKPFDGIFLSSYQNKVDEDGGDKARKELERLNET